MLKMERFIEKKGTQIVGICVLIILLGAIGALAGLCGGSALAMVWAWVCAIAGVVGPGILVLYLLENSLPQSLRAATALVYGMTSFALLTVWSSAMGTSLPLRLGVFLSLAGSMAMRLKRCRKRKRTSACPGWHKGLPLILFWAFLALISAAGAVQFAHPSAVGEIAPSQDFFWNLGNAESFLLSFPPQDLRFHGVTLTYHYLTELLAAGLSMLSGLPVYDVLAFYQTPILLALAVWVLWQLGDTVYKGCRGKKIALLACVFLLGCASLYKVWPNGQSRFWNTEIRHVLTNINGQTTATIFLALFSLLFWQLCRQGFRAGPGLFVPALFAFAGLCFAKGPVAGIVAIATASTCLLLALRRKSGCRRGALLFALLIGGGFVLLYWYYFAAGASTSMAFDVSGTLEKSYFANILALLRAKAPALAGVSLPFFMVLQVFCMTPATFFLYLRGLFADLYVLPRLDGSHLYWNAAAIGGLAAFFLFDHYAMSQIYFGFVGLFFLNLLAIDKMDRLREWLKPLGRIGGKVTAGILVAFCCVGLVTGCLMNASLMHQGFSILRNPVAAAREELESHGRISLTASEEKGMEWLRQSAGAEALFATNRIHTGQAEEGLSNVYSGLCGYPAYMESFKYAVSNMGVSIEEVENRLNVVESLFNPETAPEKIQELCQEKGIRYLAYCPHFFGSEEQLKSFEKIYDSPELRIYDLGC